MSKQTAYESYQRRAKRRGKSLKSLSDRQVLPAKVRGSAPKPTEPFGLVRRWALVDDRLTAVDFGIAVWVRGTKYVEGGRWICSRREIMKRFRLSKNTVARSLNRLRRVQVFRTKQRGWDGLEFFWPETEPEITLPWENQDENALRVNLKERRNWGL